VNIFGIQRVELASAVKLREISDIVNANLRALKSMGNVEQIANSIIIHSLMQKLDSITQAKWEEAASTDEIPTCEQFTTFLEKRCLKLENVEHATAAYTVNSQVGKNRNTNHSRNSLIATNNISTNGCVFCNNAGHSIYLCPQFANITPQIRLKEAKRLSLCLNCLKKGHQVRNCSSTACRICGRKHHTLLHLNSQPTVTQAQGTMTVS